MVLGTVWGSKAESVIVKGQVFVLRRQLLHDNTKKERRYDHVKVGKQSPSLLCAFLIF